MWFLISEEDAMAVGKVLEFAQYRACDDSDMDRYDEYKAALHTLHSGLHATTAVPSDFAPPSQNEALTEGAEMARAAMAAASEGVQS